MKSNYFLTWAPATDTQAGKNSIDRTQPIAGQVTFLCFGHENLLDHSLADRFRSLLCIGQNDQVTINWKNVERILQDPYVLYTVVLEEVFYTVDIMAWVITTACRSIEKVSLLSSPPSYVNASPY